MMGASRAPFREGYQSAAVKMAATTSETKTSNAEELVQLFKRIDYDKTVCCLKQQYAVPIEDFHKLDIAQWFDLDTSKCFMGTRKLKLNPLCIYDIFAGYCNKDKFEVKDLMRSEIVNNWNWFSLASNVCLSMKDTDFSSWFKKQIYKKAIPDELTVYALSVLFRRHTIIYNLYRPWHTVALKPGISTNVLDETYETRLLYLGDSLFGELHRKNINTLPAPIDLDDIHQARLLHCDNNVPEMYIEHVQCTELNQHNVEVPVNLQTFISPLDKTVFLQKNTTLFDPDYNPEQSGGPSGLNITQDTTSSVIGEYSVTGQVKQEPEIKNEPIMTVGSVLTENSPHCQLRIQISNIISVQNPSRTPMPTDDYSTDSTIQGGIVTPPAYPLDSTSETKTSLDTSDNNSKDVKAMTGMSQDVTTLHDTDANLSSDLVYQAGYFDESSAITITPHEGRIIPCL